jgi:hypothetical protein
LKSKRRLDTTGNNSLIGTTESPLIFEYVQSRGNKKLFVCMCSLFLTTLEPVHRFVGDRAKRREDSTVTRLNENCQISIRSERNNSYIHKYSQVFYCFFRLISTNDVPPEFSLISHTFTLLFHNSYAHF